MGCWCRSGTVSYEWIAPIIGYARDIGCVVELSAKMFEPGLVRRNTDRAHTWFALGELHGRVTPRLRELEEILSAAGKTAISTNIWGAKWTKLAVNGMFLAMCGILGIYDWEIAQNPRLFRLCIRLGREAWKWERHSKVPNRTDFGLSEKDPGRLGR
jgi:2-dehydropantoate 2-reductase